MGEPLIGATAIRPVERTGFEALSWFLYDKDTGAIMGRSLMSWLKITVFYIIYYTFLTAFWLLMIFVFFQFIDDKEPRWQMEGSLIGSSQALGVRPKQSDEMIDSSMIIFRKDLAEAPVESGEKTVVPGFGGWVNRTKDYLKPYSLKPKNAKDCSSEDKKVGDFCTFDLSILEKCNEGDFGYSDGKPCLIIKLNKIYGLIPSYYEKEDDLPENAPPEIKARMKLTNNKKQVWIHCQGENAADREMVGPIEYFPPHAGFSDTYFPFMNEEGYQSPLVAVKLTNPKVGQLLHFECRAWADNIGYHKRDRLGRVHVEIMVHDSDTAPRVNNVFRGLEDPAPKPREN